MIVSDNNGLCIIMDCPPENLTWMNWRPGQDPYSYNSNVYQFMD